MQQFRVLYSEFLFRVVDLEILTPQGEISKLLGQFAALLLVLSLWLTPFVGIFASVSSIPEIGLAGAWIAEHFLIATTMLIVGMFAVLSWDAMFPDRRDVLVLSPLPLRALTLFTANIAAVATALSLTVFGFNLFTSLLAPLEFATAPALPPPHYDAAMAPLEAADLKPVLDRDLAPAFAAPNGALAPGVGAGVTVGIVKHGKRRIFTYGTAKPDSIYEIGSTSKTFTALLLARMVAEHRVRLDEPVRDLLPRGVVPKPAGAEITLLDLATHSCSYQPGKSCIHMLGGTFGAFLFLMYKGAAWERAALASPMLYVIAVAFLASAAILLRRRTKAQSHSEGAALQFDDPPEPAILSLGL